MQEPLRDRRKNKIIFLIAVLLLVQSVACKLFTIGDLPVATSRPQDQESLPGLSSVPSKEPQGQSLPNQVQEVPIQVIPLEGPASQTLAEYSGMATYQDQVVLLPQYPQRMGDQEGGVLFAIPQQQLVNYLHGKDSQPITPRQVILVSNGMEQQISQFEGFEAIAFYGDSVYLTIEARDGLNMIGYLVSGKVIGDLESIQLDPNSLTRNPPQANQSNRTDESIVLSNDKLITFFESNGAQANPGAHATVFDLNLELQGTLPLPSIEYRLTDASEMDAQGRFWMINYFYPGDTDLLPLVDPIRERFGAGSTHSQSESVERLLEFQYSASGISLADSAPIQFQLLDTDESRNWEGLVRLADLGFLIVTDKFPGTILGFVPYP